MESVQKVLDAQYKEHVAMEAVQEAFYGLTAATLKRLSGVVVCMLDGALGKLSKAAWTTLSDVGDASPYVADISRALKLSFPIVRKRLDDGLFRNFSTTFIQAFIPRYQTSIYRARRIGETGAQQLLMDAQTIKEVLKSAPTLRAAADRFMTAIVKQRTGGAAPDLNDLDDDTPAQTVGEDGEELVAAKAPAVYLTFINRDMPRVELLLKLVSTPSDRFVDTIKVLWPNAGLTDVTKLTELKNMQKKEQTDVLVALGLAKPGALAGLGVPLNMGASIAGLTGGGAGSAAAAAAAAARAEGGSSSGATQSNPFSSSGAGSGLSSLGSGMNISQGVGKLFGGSMIGGKSKK